MKHLLALQLLFLCGYSYAQNFQISKTVVDKNTRIPLENVSVFNESDYSATNTEGKFAFISQKKEINLNLLGYNPIITTFDKLKTSGDTIFMESKATQLQEVIVRNADPYMKKVYDKFQDNLLQNYTIDFFLRNVFKKDKVNILLQDIYARENQNKIRKKSLSVEILNMRKTSFFDKKDRIDFGFPNFDDLFSNALPLINKCNFTEIPFNDSDFKKILFESNEKDESGQIHKGYFIINRKDYGIVEYTLSFIDDPEKVPYKNLSRGKYRTAKLDKFVQYTKDAKSNKYYLSNLKLDNQVEIIVYKISENPFHFDFTMDYFVTNNPSSEQINPNFATSKDIFRAKFPYSNDFWKNQNQLPLTKELEIFLKTVNEKKDKTKEFEIISNF